MGELFQQAEVWLNRIEQTQDYTLPYVDIESKTEPVRLNLMMSFWFYDGDQLEVKEKFVKKIQDYIALTGVEFQQEASVKNQRERKFRNDGFPENLLEDIRKEKTSVIYYFSDQPKMSFSPRYGIKASFSPDFANNEWYSTVNFIFPFDFTENSDKRLQCIEFFKSIVREIKVEQAYCGYRVGLPLDFTQAVPWQAFETATNYRFLGFDIEKKSQTSAVTNDEPSLEKGVRSTAWLVYLGQPWLEKLNAVQAIQKQDPNTPLRVEAINDGVFFRADESPQLARIGLPRPQGYQALNNILKPIREKMLPLTQYADSLAEWEPVFFQPEQCDWWLERWDREDDTELLEKYPVPEILKTKLD
jgi:hypothetical protein